MIPRLPVLIALAALGPRAAAAESGPAGRAVAKKTPRRWPAVALEHTTTRERFTLRPDAAGHLAPKQLKGLRRFLRCHHTGRQHAIAGRLPQLLYTVAHHFNAREVQIVAGYRAPRVAKEKGNPRSPHKLGTACDFRIAGVPLTELRDYLRRGFDKIGVGYYPNSNFVHLDVGRKSSVFWIDYSGPGQRARYSADPETDLRSGRADGGSPDDPPPPAPDGAALPPDDPPAAAHPPIEPGSSP